jgi:MoaA/NifB/PqqE/SkfB family radical SAM enzyme
MNTTNGCRFRTPNVKYLVIWELTHNCNFSCFHCCTDSSLKIEAESQNGLLDKILDVMKVANEIYFTGGEPLLNKEFVRSLAYLDGSICTLYLATNGYFLDETTVMNLKKSQFKRITVSLDGYNSVSQQLVRRGPSDSWDKTLEGIRIAVKHNLPIRVSTVISKYNVKYAEEIVQLVIELGVNAIVFNTLLPIGRAREHLSECLSKLEVEEFTIFIESLKRKYGEFLTIDSSFSSEIYQGPAKCPAGTNLLHITPNFDVSPCSWLYKIDKEKFRIGNLLENDISQCLDPEQKLIGGVSYEGICPIDSIIRSNR